MSDIEKVMAERDCARLLLDSIHYNDAQDYVALVNLYCEDGELYRPTDADTPLRRRAAILASYRNCPAARLTRHLYTNLRVDVESAERARAHCYLLVYGGDRLTAEVPPYGHAADPRRLVGEFEDELLKTNEGWRIARRRARFTLHTT